jgi:hypothetical protein
MAGEETKKKDPRDILGAKLFGSETPPAPEETKAEVPSVPAPDEKAPEEVPTVKEEPLSPARELRQRPAAGRKKTQREEATEERPRTLIRLSTLIPDILEERIQNYLASPAAKFKTKQSLIEAGIAEILDQEEKIIEEMEKMRHQLEKRR